MDYTEMSPEQLHGSALAFLLEGDDEAAAAALAQCSVERVFQDNTFGTTYGWLLTINLRAPRATYDLLHWNMRTLNQASWRDDVEVQAALGKLDDALVVALRNPAGRIREALSAVLNHGDSIVRIEIRAHVADIGDKHLLADLIDQTFGGDVSNQAPLARNARFWNNLRFRSATEIEIAKALDEAGVMFFPLSRARVTLGKQRVTREPDFLVCHNGKWGIIEVDGGPFHPPSRTTEDHERDRLFRAHGVKVVEHFDAEQCYQHPKLVVSRFLNLLSKNG